MSQYCNTNAKQHRYLKGLAGLKLCALLLIILGHCGIVIWKLTPLSRCVELLFVVSGFVAIYSYSGEYRGFSNSVIGYLKHRLVPIIPLYYFTFLYFLIVSKPALKETIMNFFMLQAWSHDPMVYFSLNGPAWFVSALLFCLAFVPAYKAYLNKTVGKHRLNVVIPLLLVFIRLLGELYLTRLNTSLMSIHTSPIIRLLDFMIGGYAAQCFLVNNDVEQSNRENLEIRNSILEIILLMTIICLDGILGNMIPRTVYVVLFATLIYIIAFGKGIISKALSISSIQFISKYQLPLYLLHTMVGSIVVLSFTYLNIDINESLELIIKFLALLFACYSYNRFIKRKAECISRALLHIT